MPPSATPADIFQELTALHSFTVKGSVPKQGRWFSWNQVAHDQLPESTALRMAQGLVCSSLETVKLVEF